MRRTILGVRTADPAYFDMSGRFPVPAMQERAKYGFRISDRAWIHLFLLDWRARNPDRRLVVLTDDTLPDNHFGKQLRMEWVAGGLADEVWDTADPHEDLPMPEGEPLFTDKPRNLYFKTSIGISPDIKPPTAVSDDIRNWLAPQPYVTVHPLVDAERATHRNETPDWWERLVRRLAPHVRMVLVGDARVRELFNLPPAVLRAFDLGLLGSLDLIGGAVLHIGGETGVTQWASIFDRPVLACCRRLGGRQYPVLRAPVVRQLYDDGPGAVAARVMVEMAHWHGG